jgi:putative hydrolase of the HAD superfamily
LPALAALAQRGVKLGVISNWDDRLRPLLAALNLTRFFASIVVSCELGVTKPDPRLFRQAAAELGVAPGELLHVGDSAVMDVAGAQGAGAVGCRVRRRAAAAAVHEVRSLTELIGRLGN